jgi:alanine transaminase
VGQVPLTFHRQVLALCMYPDLMENEQAMTGFPADAVTRAKEILDGTGGNGLGES